MSNYNNFLKTINVISNGNEFSKHEIFNDFLKLSTFAIHNQYVFFRNDFEEEYKKIFSKYTLKQRQLFPLLLKIVEEALREKHQDFLGEFFMKSCFYKQDIGQEFSPYCISKLLSKLLITNDVKEKKDKIIQDCCCGSGSLLIAAHEFNPNIIVFGQDIDEYCVYMSFIQLSFLKIKGIIIWGNSLTLEEKECFITPSLFFN